MRQEARIGRPPDTAFPWRRPFVSTQLLAAPISKTLCTTCDLTQRYAAGDFLYRSLPSCGLTSPALKIRLLTSIVTLPTITFLLFLASRKLLRVCDSMSVADLASPFSPYRTDGKLVGHHLVTLPRRVDRRWYSMGLSALSQVQCSQLAGP